MRWKAGCPCIMQSNYRSPYAGYEPNDGEAGIHRPFSCAGAADYAGFWVRLAAYAIDSVIVFAGLLFVRLSLAVFSSLLSGTWMLENILFHYTLKDLLLYGCQVLYFILCTYLTGTTPGKRLMNLRVVSACPDEPLKLWDVIYRETIGRFLCSFFLGLGYIIAGLDREKRGLHDILCDTRVIYAKKIRAVPGYPGTESGNR